jgi:hypothetical protein
VSDALYSTRLRYSHGSGAGIAKLHGVCVSLKAPPSIPCCPLLAEVDYVPEIGLGRIRTATEGWRDMEAIERHEADALLRSLVP